MYISSAMSSGLVSMFPCLSFRLSKVVLSVFLKITLWILLGCKFNVFLYLEIAFLQLVRVCFVMMSRAFVSAFLPMLPSVLIHSLISIGSSGGFGIFACGWFCMLVSNGCVRQLVSEVVSLMVFRIMWYVDSSFFHCFWIFLGRYPPCLLVCLFDWLMLG